MKKSKLNWVDAASGIAVILFAMAAETSYWPGTAHARVIEVEVSDPYQQPRLSQMAASVEQELSLEEAEKRGWVTAPTRQRAPETAAAPQPRQPLQPIQSRNTPATDIPDPAGDSTTSASLAMDTPIVSSIRAGDRDCFRVAPQGGALVITLRPEPFGPQNAALFDRELRALDARGAVVAEKVDWEDDEQTMTLPGGAAAKARFVCVRGRFDAWVGDYELSISRPSR